MRTFGIIMLCILAVIGGGVAWYKISYPTYVYRYRLSIAVDIDGQTKTASSVIEVRNVTQPKFGSAPPVLTFMHGEAVFLDLGQRGNVIAILGYGPNGSDVDRAGTLVLKKFGLDLTDKNLVRLESLRGSRDLTGNEIPTFVTFTNLNDPNSARVVRLEQFEQAFGPDVQFKRAWVEMTTDPVTHGIEQKMPEIAKRLREKDRVMQIQNVGDPFSPRSGHFFIK